MKRDYLWDRSGDPDGEIQALEKTLAPLKYSGGTPEIYPDVEPVRESRVRSRRAWQVAAALAAAVVLAAASWLYYSSIPSYAVASLTGSPQVGASRLDGQGRLKVDQWLQTDEKSRARMQVGYVGQVDIGPNTRLKIVEAQPQKHRLLLQRGILHATIWAPPRLFYVDTPFAEVEDLGCAYTLQVGDDGTGWVEVTTGWVAFRHGGRESFVPEGAVCRTYPGAGPGAPFRKGASPALKSALAVIDADADASGVALAVVLAEARKEDGFTLWHLLTRLDGPDRARACDRLGQLTPMPQGVTMQGILAGDARALDLWWDALGLGDAGWWRLWERPWPARN